MAPTAPRTVIDTALDRANDPKASYRAASRRKEKARVRGRKFYRSGRIAFGGSNPDRRQKRSVCRMFGIGGKRYRALERRHRLANRLAKEFSNG